MNLTAAVVAAAWCGVLTSISPCPLATNIAAVSFLSRRMHSRRMAVAGAVAYTLGRATVYGVLGFAVAWGLAAAPRLSSFLQQGLFPFLGPLLIVVGLVLLGWIRLPLNFGLKDQSIAQRLASSGLLGEFLLGMVFALTFCPVSAALFFGTLLPMAVTTSQPLLLFVVYGIGTALPVGAIAVLVALGLAASSKIIAGVQRWEGKIQGLTAWIILAIGVALTFARSFGGLS
jgi:cytochrome c biogenesis protein CcdA